MRYFHPDFQRVIESEEFDIWLAQQPDAVRELAHSPLHRDAIAMLDAFKLDTSPRISGMPPAPDVLH